MLAILYTLYSSYTYSYIIYPVLHHALYYTLFTLLFILLYTLYILYTTDNLPAGGRVEGADGGLAAARASAA